MNSKTSGNTIENMSEKSIKFRDKKITKQDTVLFKIDNIEVDKILISKTRTLWQK